MSNKDSLKSRFEELKDELIKSLIELGENNEGFDESKLSDLGLNVYRSAIALAIVNELIDEVE